MMKCSKDGGRAVVYTSDLGKSTVTERVLRTLKDEGKLESLMNVQALGAEIAPAPQPDEATVFIAFFDVGL